MAKEKNNIFMMGLSGTIGKQMTLSQKGGFTIVGRKRGSSNIPATDDQLDIQSRFRIASKYALGAIQDPVTKAAYAAVATGNQSAYNVALADAFTPPEIVSIDISSFHATAGDTIIIRAIDFFKVVSVTVTIHDHAGLVLEVGQALKQTNNLDWKFTVPGTYPAGMVGKITATATDLPGNQTKKEVPVA